MSHTRLLLFAIASWACSLVIGELHAQTSNPRSPSPQYVQAQRGQKATNANARGMTPVAVAVQMPESAPRNPAEVPLTYIAVIGAVNQPAVFETTERSLPLGALIERAGGVSSDSNGGVCMLELGHSHLIEPLARNLKQQIGNGQIVYIVPQGGVRPTQLLASRPVTNSKKILITGLTNGPRLFQLGNQRLVLGDLLFSLGQSTDMLAGGALSAASPQSGQMTLDSELVANSIIHFNPEAVNYDGLREAFARRIPIERPVRFETQPANALAPTAPVAPPSQRSAPIINSPPPPRIEPGNNGPLPLGTTSLIPETLSPSNSPSSIEAAGSTTSSREPLPFPKESDKDSLPTVPSTKADGRPPLMLPKSWKSSDASTDGESKDRNTGIIERTSAGHHRNGHQVVTASATHEESKPTQAKPASGLDLTEIEKEGLSQESETTSLLPGPQSWLILVLVGGIVGASILVSRLTSRPDFTSSTAKSRSQAFPVQAPSARQPMPVQKQTSAQQPVTIKPVVASTPIIPVVKPAPAREAVPAPQAAPVPQVANTDADQRFLQRLIMNKVTVVEEKAELPTVDHLHGMAVGASRMIVHEAHETIAGPHFLVRPKGDVREIELRLRRLMRTDRAAKREEVVHTADVRETRETQIGPLERALRTVDRGVTQ